MIQTRNCIVEPGSRRARPLCNAFRLFGSACLRGRPELEAGGGHSVATCLLAGDGHAPITGWSERNTSIKEDANQAAIYCWTWCACHHVDAGHRFGGTVSAAHFGNNKTTISGTGDPEAMGQSTVSYRKGPHSFNAPATVWNLNAGETYTFLVRNAAGVAHRATSLGTLWGN